MQLSNSSPSELAALLQAELVRDETVLWESQSLSAQWTVQDWVRHDPIHKRWYLLVPGLSKFAGKMLTGAARNILYVVTDQRAMLVCGTMSLGNVSRPSWVISIATEELLDRKVTVRADESGDLLFPHARSSYPSADGPKNPQNVVGFHGIPNVKDVDELIGRTFETKDRSF